MDPPKFSRITLDNGLTILLQKQSIGSTSFGVGVKFGSAHHPAAHFLEHLLFKGTPTRTYKEINRQAVRWGGSLDAFTDFFTTFYVTKNLSSYTYDALDLLCDMVSRSTIPREEFEYERKVLLEEHRMRSGEPEFILTDAIYRKLYSDHPIGKAVLDNRQIISRISYEEIQEIYHKFYIPSRIIIVGIGEVDENTVLKTVKKYFSGFENNSPEDPIMPSECALQPPRKVYIHQPSKEVKLMVGFKTTPCTHPDYYPVRILSSILGESINSRLYEKARERKGLVYNITSHYNIIRSSWQSLLKADCSCWHGVLRVYTCFSLRNLSQVQGVIKEELQKIGRERVLEKELLMNQQRLIGENQLALLGTFKHMYLLLAAEANNVAHDFSQFEEKVLSVTPDDVARAAQKYCTTDGIVQAVLKP